MESYRNILSSCPLLEIFGYVCLTFISLNTVRKCTPSGCLGHVRITPLMLGNMQINLHVLWTKMHRYIFHSNKLAVRLAQIRQEWSCFQAKQPFYVYQIVRITLSSSKLSSCKLCCLVFLFLSAPTTNLFWSWILYNWCTPCSQGSLMHSSTSIFHSSPHAPPSSFHTSLHLPFHSLLHFLSLMWFICVLHGQLHTWLHLENGNMKKIELNNGVSSFFIDEQNKFKYKERLQFTRQSYPS